jgi:hypothetical protein
MLQPFPARPFFRVLEAPLGVAIIGAGTGFVILSIDGVRNGSWSFAPFGVVGLVFIVVGSLGVIHAITGGLPEWVAGDGRDDEGENDSMNGRGDR